MPLPVCDIMLQFCATGIPMGEFMPLASLQDLIFVI
jgi:hypothetical protein